MKFSGEKKKGSKLKKSWEIMRNQWEVSGRSWEVSEGSWDVSGRSKGGHREVVEGQWETIAIVLSSEILRLFRIQSVFLMLMSNSNDHL